jgi:hypothetical protein
VLALSSIINPRRNARHAKPSKAAPALLAGGLTAALAVADAGLVAGTASAGGSVAQFERLASCESGGNWAINTGNGYYGGLQFNLATWRGVGMGGYPHQASKAQQIAAGQKLHSQRGWRPWPSCSRKMGLSGNGGYAGSGAETLAAAATRTDAASRSRRAAPAAPALARSRRAAPAAPALARTSAAPAFDGHVMTVRDVRTRRAATRLWQQQMTRRGYPLVADGLFGRRSSAAAAAFARAKGLPTPRGTVDAALWTATWTAR